MKKSLSELIEVYLKGEIDIQILINAREDILKMNKQEKNKLRIYLIAIGLLSETRGEKLNEVFLILTKLNRKKMVFKIIDHRKVMGYDKDISTIKDYLEIITREIYNPFFKKKNRKVYFFWLKTILDSFLGKKVLKEQGNEITSFVISLMTNGKLKKDKEIIEKTKMVLEKLGHKDISDELETLDKKFLRKAEKTKKKLSKSF